MTNREFFNAILANSISPEVLSFAAEQIKKLDERNAKRSSIPSKIQKENQPIIEKIREIFMNNENNDYMLSSEVAEKVGISVQKASALLRQMVENGELKAEEIKVPKKGKQKGYKINIDNENDSVKEE